MIGNPKYELEFVKRLVEEGKVWFSAPSRSIDEVIRVYRSTAHPKGRKDAENFILAGIKALQPDHYAGRTLQWEKDVADQYGIILDRKPWFVKFLVSPEGELEQISFHPPEKDLKIKSGEVIPAEVRT